ncbi:MAG: coproporphyrinogen III oxidase [Spirochaetae bacterium HGW-Spirochaetae-8]|nr:MAG: coproporphyrinogen III oxidase [Spirochaetae bacterium HGW-Spirochaetae-8]
MVPIPSECRESKVKYPAHWGGKEAKPPRSRACRGVLIPFIQTLLADVPSATELSLYIHIPFCITKCAYCAFFSKSGENHATLHNFTIHLLEELQQMTARRTQPYKTVFIGGGNPGCLEYQDLQAIVEVVCSQGKPDEFTIEMNPESLREDIFPLFGQGITRLSIGLQSMQEKHLSMLGRNASLSDNLRALKSAILIRKRYGTYLNFDLMTCIPGQGIEDAMRDIEVLVQEAQPEHISLYSLTIEEGSKLAEMVGFKTFNPLGETQQAEILETCWNVLAALGYEHYEVSNFSKSGADCQHNLRYWNLQPYVGLGPSAVGTVVTPHGLVRWTGKSSIHDYISTPAFSSYSMEKLSSDEEITEYLLVSLRTKQGIDKSSFAQRFNRSFDEMFGRCIKKIQRSNPIWILDNPVSFSLTEQGWMVMDAIVLDMVLDAGL